MKNVWNLAPLVAGLADRLFRRRVVRRGAVAVREAVGDLRAAGEIGGAPGRGPKPQSESGTIWGSFLLAVYGACIAFYGHKTDNADAVREGVAFIIGAFIFWRQRLGVGRPIIGG
jgi:hypothetical protein